MESYLTQIASYLWTQSWQIAILVVIIAAISLLLKNKSAHIRYLLWLVLLAKCLAPPLLTIPLAILPQEQIIVQPIISTTANIPTIIETTVYEPVTLPSAVVESTIFDKFAAVTTPQWIGSVWILGVVIFVLVAGIKAMRLNCWLKRARKPITTDRQRDIKDLFTELNDKKFPKIWLVDDIAQPFVWGLLRGGIYLPSNFAEIKAEEHRRGILSHELSHVIRFDAAINLLQIIAQAVFWFHPLIWWANKNIRAEREKCCDEMAIAALGTKARDFSTAIVNILTTEHRSTHPIPSLAIAGPVRNIEERIKTMMTPSKKFYKRPSTLAAFTILLLGLIIVPTTLALTSRTNEKADIQEKKSQKELSKFKKTLANGITIELIGICKYPSAGKQWWRPDGSRLEGKITTIDKSNYISEYPGYEIAFKISGQDYNFIRGRIKGSKESSNLNVIDPENISAHRVHIKPSTLSSLNRRV